MISLHEVSKSYSSGEGVFKAVESVSLTIREGSIHGIIGPSGAGKSTLLRMMNVLEPPDSGKVIVGGQDLTRLPESQLRVARRSMGMVFQQFHLLHNRTVSGNVAVPLELAGMSKRQRKERVEECLQFVGLQDKAKQYPARLSGGQKQRVAIARALAHRPAVLLCDEPTSSLDSITTGEILNVLRHINETLGVTVVIVTHEMDVVKEICHEVSVVEQGRLTDGFALEERTARNVPRHKPSYRDLLLGKAGVSDV
ncbi:ATP-binding cassette domain-containing protein [Paenibacillus sp. Marseille-P2973]|uniref:methionine ABC transporter ATP-binding protein n=1 Tax=Paenibacillus sp. Marseille-P2973 TaxID=1871032 RepID=UPI001B378D0F|nr:ATP-binding cassette domain-containing protein [Paenibacillus sp. Marseille-P2973]MBQ4899133.1 ATP-binding cassette domain-containing protein [Paenibacillus sp. Marseille-P2973]